MTEALVANGMPRLTVESIFTSDWGCGMNEGQGTPATPVQLANCRLLDRAPLDGLESHPHIVRAYGSELPSFGEYLRALMVVAGIRSAKSMMMSACAIKIARTCYVGKPVKASDSLRVPIVSPEIDTSKATLHHVMGILENSELLRPLIVKSTADSVIIEHESGREVEIKVVALAQYGKTLVGRWIPGIIFEEIFLMGSEVDYVKNLEEARNAIHGRILPGGLEMLIGSAEGAIGPAFELYQKHWGQPNADFLVCKAEGPLMNPVTYSPENCEDLERRNPDAYKKNVLCIFADPVQAMLSLVEITAARRETGNLDPVPHWEYSAGMDPATRSNAWSFVILGGRPDGGFSVVYAHEWKPTANEPLNPKEVLAEIAGALKRYRVPHLMTDQNMAESLIAIAADLGVTCICEDLTGSNRLPMANEIVELIKSGMLELPNNDQLAKDLQNVRRKISSNGNASLALPETKDGRHCDYVPALMLANRYQPGPPEIPEAYREPEPLEDWAANQETPHGRYSRALRVVAG